MKPGQRFTGKVVSVSYTHLSVAPQNETDGAPTVVEVRCADAPKSVVMGTRVRVRIANMYGNDVTARSIEVQDAPGTRWYSIA